jgi:hypothetical protein
MSLRGSMTDVHDPCILRVYVGAVLGLIYHSEFDDTKPRSLHGRPFQYHGIVVSPDSGKGFHLGILLDLSAILQNRFPLGSDLQFDKGGYFVVSVWSQLTKAWYPKICLPSMPLSRSCLFRIRPSMALFRGIQPGSLSIIPMIFSCLTFHLQAFSSVSYCAYSALFNDFG